ncbi:hypothetical protein FN846DRAFT_895618 [Sphaerosporella brunnea]|uniref:histidine kinase n=1 Tax=Sphaerosporella brunnea TaxID=1250544 RepID=A0A5J5EF26_9PEZI|nr:hypothetical protein FN846DRAFT_895618 [Sphaerosporella brunnea]
MVVASGAGTGSSGSKELEPNDNDNNNNNDGYQGDCHRSLRIREVFKNSQRNSESYWQPAAAELKQSIDPWKDTTCATNGHPDYQYHPNLVSSYDPLLAMITNHTARVLNAKRAMVTMIAGSQGYVVAEATRSLSITAPHTHDPGDHLWLGAGTAFPTANSLCLSTVSMVPPEPEAADDQPLLNQIPDMSKVEQLCVAPFVKGWPHNRFYAAVPLRTKNGVNIGTLCVMDPEPRPDGLSEEEKMRLCELGDIVMNYLVTKQGERDIKKSKAMELGLSRFIAEGFLPGEGVEMTERRDGRLLDLGMLEQRRIKELERKKKVEEKRLMFQQRKFAEMIKEREREWQKERESLQAQIESQKQNPTTALERGKAEERRPSLPVVVVPIAEEEEDPTELSLMETVILSTDHPLPTPSPPICLYSGAQLTPPASSARDDSCTTSTYFDSSASTSGTSSSSSDQSAPRRKSAYEKTSSFEPQFRAMFFRAASLIRNGIDADVVFLDGDLEGFFGSEAECDRPHNCGFSHISTDKEAEQATRAERPKACRRRSGILGYATAGGSSNSWGPATAGGCSSRHDSFEQLGFDVGELSEEALNELVEDNEYGRIVAHVDDSDAPPQALSRTDEILRRFLPGAKSVILVPLWDHNRKLFAVCFAWTSATRTFTGDVEGSFVTAVANCILAETTRLNILHADKAKGEFISSISHELRTPIHGILASAEFLAESSLDAYQRSFVDTVVSCGRTLLDTINHVLDFQKLNSLSNTERRPSAGGDAAAAAKAVADPAAIGKPGAGAKYTQMVDTDLGALVQDIIEGVCLGSEFQSSAAPVVGMPETPVTQQQLLQREDGSQITVILDIDHRRDGWVFLTHPAALKRVINNIAGNAMKYTDAGWVRVRLRADEMEADAHGNPRAMVRISVSDSGKGISREFLKTKLFTPFSQENPLAAGAGLGMSIVRQIVEVLRGKIDVKSQVGKGTKVTVSVPLLHRVPGVPAALNLNAQLKRGSNTAGLKLGVKGFKRFVKTKRLCPTGEAANFLRASIERYARDYFGMRVLRDDDAADQADIVIVNETPDEEGQAAVLESLAGGTAPVIVLCGHPPMDGGASRFYGRAATFVRKPCGPKKLEKAMAFCLEEILRGQQQQLCTDTDYETAQESCSTDSDDDDDDEQRLTRSTSSTLTTPSTPPIPGPDSWLPKEEKQLPRILAVEDNKINLMLLTTFLKRKGYPFEVAADGLEALQKVKATEKKGGYDVILMDLQMPVMGGIESTREIRQFEAEAGQKKSLIVALTGLAATSVQREAFEAGVDSFMVKPVSFKALERTLDEGLSSGTTN